MAVYQIGYDLKRPGQDYKNLIAAIEAYGTYYHLLDSTWIIASSWSAEHIRDDLVKHIDANDRLLVTRLNGEAAWYGFPDNGNSWLKEQLSRAYAA